MVTPPGGCDHRGIPDPVNSLTPPSSEAEPRSDRWPGDAPAASTRDGARPGSGWDVQIGTWGGWHAHRRHGGRGPFRRFGRGPLRRSSDAADLRWGGQWALRSLRVRRHPGPDRLRAARPVRRVRRGRLPRVVADPPDRGPGSGHRRRGSSSDRRGILLSLAFLPALVATLVVFSALHVGFVTSFAWPFFVCAAALVLIWRNCDPEERAWLRQVAEPVIQLGERSEQHRRVLVLRLALGAAPPRRGSDPARVRAEAT